MIMSLKQKKIKFKPTIKLNHNIYMSHEKLFGVVLTPVYTTPKNGFDM